MTQIERYQKHVETVGADRPVAEAADRMRLASVGCLVVVSGDGQPVGLVTDRDLCVRVVAEGRDPDELRVSAVMSQPLVAVSPTDSIEQVIDTLREHRIRRVPVVKEKQVTGLVSLDDLVVTLAGELSGVAAAVRVEIEGSQRQARLREVRREIEDGLTELIGHAGRIGDRTREAAVDELRGIAERVRALFR